MSRKGILLQRISNTSPRSCVVPDAMITTDGDGFTTLTTTTVPFVNVTTTGNTTLGDASADTLTINATVAADVLLGTTKKLLLRDTATSVSSANAGYMDIAAVTGIRLATTAVTITGTLGVTGTSTVTSAGATALAVGLNGATNPAFVVDASTATSATGVKVKSAAAAGGVAISALSSGTDEALTIDAKGAGMVSVGVTSTGGVTTGKLLYKNFTEVVAATNIITAAESGAVFFLNSATEFVSTLPAVAAGLHYTFVVTAAPSGASYTIVTNASANVINGKQFAVDGNAGDFGTTDDTITFVDGQSVVGDMVEVICDGTTRFAYAHTKIPAGLTFTTAS